MTFLIISFILRYSNGFLSNKIYLDVENKYLFIKICY